MTKIPNLPNILTISRIVVIPIIIAMFYLGNGRIIHLLSAALFAYACITDFLDGYLARAWSQQSSFGRVLDPIADKLLVGALIVMLVHRDRIDIFPALAIICREILVSGLREYLAEIAVRVRVSNLAKIKTALQMVALFIILIGSEGLGFGIFGNVDYIYWLGRITLWVAAILTLYTGYEYLKAGMRHID